MEITVLIENIERYCEKIGEKPTVVCTKSGAGKDTLTHLKNRGSVPSVEKIALLAKYLGCSVSNLIGDETETAPPTTPEEQQAALLAAELLKVGVDVRTLSPREMATIARIAKAALDG